MKTPITPRLIAPCGMNCGICMAYLREHNPCTGCRDTEQEKHKAIAQCFMRVCTRRTGKFCCHCPEFPCDRLRRLDKCYRTKYGMSEIENLEFIRKHGIRKFVASERKRWVSEKGVLCVHNKQHYK
jgi:hypothetical protein